MSYPSVVTLPTWVLAWALPRGTLFWGVYLVYARIAIASYVLFRVLGQWYRVFGLVHARANAYVVPNLVSVFRSNIGVCAVDNFTFCFRISFIRDTFGYSIVRRVFCVSGSLYKFYPVLYFHYLGQYSQWHDWGHNRNGGPYARSFPCVLRFLRFLSFRSGGSIHLRHLLLFCTIYSLLSYEI